MEKPTIIQVKIEMPQIVNAVIKTLIEKGTLIEPVRCKYCIHYDGEDGQCPLQSTGDSYYDTTPQKNFYCAYGEVTDA